ncbi:zinc finger protein 62 [Procambarus clarkii]|uniref:zinc finger protein 62 n=1 Tax=Procambarus clarkii TaxID=6728 RepID=UPI003742D37D
MGRSRKLSRKLLKRTAENRQSADEKQCNEDEKHTEKLQENGDLQQTGEHQQPGALTKTIIHRCNICQLTFTTTLSFERHMKRHEADKPHKCQHCDKKFVTKSGLDIHRRKHTGERPYKCDNCSKAFTTRSVLIMHMRGHTGEKPYECNICGARFTQSATQADHMRRHTGEEQYQCTTCQKKFVTRINYRGHILVCQRKSKIECKICKKLFINKFTLKSHMVKHSNERPFECGECGNKFKSKTSLASHLKSVHSNKEPHKCDICMKSYTTRRSLIMHTMTHTNIGRFQCEQCGRMLNSKRHVLRHQTSQNGCKRKYVFKPFFCKQCGAQFTSDRAVRDHKHRTPDCTKTLVRFLCDFCREDCKTYEGLVTHLLDHAEPGRKGYDNLLNRMTHGKKRVNPAWIVKVYNSGTVSTPRDNRAQCEQCGRMFISKSHLLRHQTSQTRCKRNYVFKQFFCKQCGAQFNSNSTASHHKYRNPDCTKTHVRFLCDFCREDCKTYEGLVTHLLDHAEPGRKGYDNLLDRMTHNKERINPAWIVKVYNSGSVSTSRDDNGAHINIDQRQATSVPTDHTPAVHKNTAVDHQRGNVDEHKTAVDHHETAEDHQKTAVDHHKTAVGHHETAVDLRKTVVEHHETDVDHHKTAVNHHKTAIDLRKTAVDHNETAVDHHKTAVDLRKSAVGHHETTVDHHKTAVDHHDTAVDHHDTAVDHHKTAVDHHDRAVDHHKTAVDHHDRAVDHHKTAVDHHDRAVDHHKTAVDHHKTAVDHHKTAVDHHKTAVDQHKTAVDHHKTAVDHHKTAVDHHKTAVDHHKTAVDHHKTAVNVFSQDTCLTSETNFESINTNDKLNKDEGRKYLGNNEAYYENANEKPHKCDICMKSYTTRRYLIMHTMTHTNIGRFQCEQCGRMFNSKRHVLRHQTSQNGCKRKYVFKPFFCKQCGAQFNSDAAVRKHKRRTPDCTKTHVRFLCDFCREDCKTYEGLVTHLLDHAEPGRKGYDNLLNRMTHGKKRVNPAWIVKVYNSGKVSTPRDNIGAHINIDQRQASSVPTDHSQVVHNNTAVDHQRGNADYHKTAIDHLETSVDNHKTAVNVFSQDTCLTSKTNFDNINTNDKLNKDEGRKYLGNTDAYCNLDSNHVNGIWGTCQDLDNNYISTRELQVRDKCDIEVVKHACVMQRSYPMITEAEEVGLKEEEETEDYNLESKHIDGIWGTCQDLGNDYYSTREHKVKEKCDIEVIKDACVMQRSYPMIKEAEEVSVKEENETVEKWVEEPEMQKTSDRQFLKSTSLLIVNGITTIKREACHPAPHTSVPHY